LKKKNPFGAFYVENGKLHKTAMPVFVNMIFIRNSFKKLSTTIEQTFHIKQNQENTF